MVPKDTTVDLQALYLTLLTSSNLKEIQAALRRVKEAHTIYLTAVYHDRAFLGIMRALQVQRLKFLRTPNQDQDIGQAKNTLLKFLRVYAQSVFYLAIIEMKKNADWDQDNPSYQEAIRLRDFLEQHEEFIPPESPLWQTLSFFDESVALQLTGTGRFHQLRLAHFTVVNLAATALEIAGSVYHTVMPNNHAQITGTETETLRASKQLQGVFTRDASEETSDGVQPIDMERVTGRSSQKRGHP